MVKLGGDAYRGPKVTQPEAERDSLTFLYLSSQVSWGKQGPALVSCRVRPHLRLNGDSTGNHGPMLPLSEAGFCDCPPGQSLTGQ